MSFDTYTNLKAEIADHLDRDDLAEKIDSFIALAETRIRRDIRIRELVAREAISINDRYVALPTGTLEVISLRLLTDPVTRLEYVSPEQINEYRTETSGKPKYFTITSEFQFDKTPDETYSGELIYHKAADALSDSNETNEILTRAPDVYLYGALVASAPYLMNDERIQTWGMFYKAGVDGLATARRQDRVGGTLRSRVRGSTP